MGAKKFEMSLETREIKLFWRDIPGFCRDSPEAPEKFEKKSLCSRSGKLKSAGQRQERPLSCNAAFSMLHCSFSLAAAQLLVKMTSALQKSQCCSATSAALHSAYRSATSGFACLGARLRGRTATQRSKKGSENVLGRVLGKGFSEGF